MEANSIDKMYYNRVSLREFEEKDIKKKIEWINNPNNNKYLHYDLPLEYNKTLAWYEKIKLDNSRFDCVVEYNGVPVGLIGLLNIDSISFSSEYYITLGEEAYKNKGIATKASKLILNYAFQKLDLLKIYLYVENDNIVAQKLYENLGFLQKTVLKNYLHKDDRYIDMLVYVLEKCNFNQT